MQNIGVYGWWLVVVVVVENPFKMHAKGHVPCHI
jgi:hypothetical protein